MTDTPRKTPQVVVACAWYNRADYIRDTVDSVLAQDFDDFEIVIVNDGSPDPRVREILDSYDDPRLRVIHQENTGFVGAITRAIAASDAPFIAIQGAGEVSHRQRLKNQWDFLESNLDHVAVSSVASNVLIKKDDTRHVVSQTRPVEHVTTDKLIEANRLIHGASMFRRNTFETVGGYRPVFKYAQDYDLWLRMSRHGYLSVINSIDVTRNIFEVDGIASAPAKTLIQARLACLARNCAVEYKKSGIDIVQTYGNQSMLFLRPDKKISKRTAGAYLKMLIDDYSTAPSDLARQAWSDNWNYLSFGVMATSQTRWSRLSVSKILRFFSKSPIRNSHLS